MAAEAAQHLRCCPRIARALCSPLFPGRVPVPPTGAQTFPTPGLLAHRLSSSSNSTGSAGTPGPQALPAGRSEGLQPCSEPRPAAPLESRNDGSGKNARPRLGLSWDARPGEGPFLSGLGPQVHAAAPSMSGSFSGAWGTDVLGLGGCRRPGVAWRDLPFGVGPARPLSSDATGRKSGGTQKTSSKGADEDSSGEDGSREEGQRGVEGAVSVRELAHLEEGSAVLLRRAEIEGLLVEGLPVGLEREFSPDAGPPAPAYPFLLRKQLRDLLQALQAHAQAVQGEAAEAGGDDGAPSSLLPAGSASGTVPGALAPASDALRRHWLLLGPSGSGKSVLLALAAAWARANGWLVLYVPRAREWVRGGLYYPHPHAPPPDQAPQQPRGARCSLWDTPLQAQQALEHLLAAHRGVLAECPLRNRDALALGEAPSADRASQQRVRPLPAAAEEPQWSLADLASLGAEDRDASVSALLRLREELPHVKGTPVLIAIDEYNAWFTFSTYFEATGDRSRRQIHANELRMVRALRPLAQEETPGAGEAGPPSPSPVVLAAAFSESIAVGRLAPRLPGVPKGASFPVPRFTLPESRQLLENHLRRRDGPSFQEPSDDMVLRAHHLAVGSGIDLRQLSMLIDARG